MAQLLIMAFDTFGKDPESDRLAWKTGHVVDVKPDDHVWGKKEGPPKFYVLKAPGVKVEEAQAYLEAKLDLTNVEEPVQTGIRKFRFDIDSMGPIVKNGLLTSGEVAVTERNIIDWMKLV